jgi:hypothetical protein
MSDLLAEGPIHEDTSTHGRDGLYTTPPSNVAQERDQSTMVPRSNRRNCFFNDNRSRISHSCSNELAEARSGSYTMTIEIVTRAGKTIHTGGEFKPDGSLNPVSGSEELDVATFAMPNRRSLVMGAALAGQPRHTRVWTLSDDGTYMTETIVGHIDGKTPHIRTAIWRRAKRD